MDQYQQKKQLESLLVNYFKLFYPGFPEGRLIESESPDFLLHLNNKFSIGIELTRLYPESHKILSEKESEAVKFKDELVEKVFDFFESQSNLKCLVKVLFSESFKLLPEDILTLSVRISRLILGKVNCFKETGFNQSVIRKNLPRGIETILILNSPGLEYSVFERSNNLGISTNILDDINYSIHKKDEKLRLYLKQNLDEYWLLITTDILRQQKPINISNQITKCNFKSHFKKVIIFELISGKVTELI